MNEKGATYVDENGVIIEPVSVYYNEVLSFIDKK